ncbi:MAG: hypothetical protein UT24_C0015G0003 [Candidatus Woesebacteria bacterium GW2011_GWB1_39_12]|uniref:peptidyl-tRNA hydrolase n=1 Tax=Candidatus Woesebacteria bacterium GW2011_GWB1_39_12 TaxID=1618574 RepID=A0A0G0PPV4_9BACT|nr:MAG: hypothetical protein UT24_C0015G0003 [Candidatus Woesebacteria bacterium GW2011_GWB1_39_12]
MSEIKQVIVIRKDLKMRRGKEIAQCCHSSIAFLSNRIRHLIDCSDDDIFDLNGTNIEDILCLSKPEIAWIKGNFAKICLQVESEEELLEINRQAKEAGLVCELIKDSGLTEFAGVATITCLAIGPDYSEKIDPITGSLRLY